MSQQLCPEGHRDTEVHLGDGGRRQLICYGCGDLDRETMGDPAPGWTRVGVVLEQIVEEED